MLALAELKAAKDVSEALIWERRSSLFFIPANLYPIFTRGDVENCFLCVRRHLTEEGRLLIELLFPSAKMLAREADRRYPVGQYEDPKVRSQVFVTEEVHFDAASQIDHVEWLFRNGGSGKETVLSLEMGQFFSPEIDALLWYNDFLIEYQSGSYDEAELSSDAWKQLIICRPK